MVKVIYYRDTYVSIYVHNIGTIFRVHMFIPKGLEMFIQFGELLFLIGMKPRELTITCYPVLQLVTSVEGASSSFSHCERVSLEE